MPRHWIEFKKGWLMIDLEYWGLNASYHGFGLCFGAYRKQYVMTLWLIFLSFEIRLDIEQEKQPNGE